MSETGEVRVVEMDDDFSEKSGRSKFSTKVLVTVFIQFGILVAFCNGFMYGSLSDYIDPSKNSSSYWTLIVSCILVPIILIVFFMKPNLMTQAPKCYISLVFLTCVIGMFTGFVAVYVSEKYYQKGSCVGEGCPLAPEQVIPSALYGTMICLLICMILNFIMDMETQFTIMLVIQLVLAIPTGFLMWFILGYDVAIVFACLAFICGVMTWIMFFLRMIFFADFLQNAADDMGAESVDNMWIFAAILLYVQICRLFVGIVKLIIVTE